MSLGSDTKISDDSTIVEDFNFDSYHVNEITSYAPYTSYEELTDNNILESNQINILKETLKPVNGPMDSAWPMYCHDVRHTGRSPYSTADNTGIEKWRFPTYWWTQGNPVIDKDGIIYFGTTYHFYAMYPNGTLKWQIELGSHLNAPALDENGVIYVGTAKYISTNYLYAIYTNNGTIKWRYYAGGRIGSSPAIGSDGTIYCGCYDGHIFALYPNGTLKWKYTTGNVVLSSPAIGEDGTIYCGSHDTYLYALYSNNGTIKWKFPTGYYVRVGPCIGDDGTIYCVSRDGYLYAVYPNGTMRWQTYVSAGPDPTIGQDGTIYAGWKNLYAINPINGSIKWMFDLPDRVIEGGTPCNSIDGTIYFGTHISYVSQPDGGELIAVNPDGTEKWRIMIATDFVDSAPAIGKDGTIYVGSVNELNNPGDSEGYLHAIGPLDPEAPSAPDINGPTSGNYGIDYEYTFKSTSPLGLDVYYNIEWGDGTSDGWLGPHSSGEIVNVSHTWSKEGTYVIKAQAKDTNDLKSDWGTLTVTMPRNKATDNVFLLRLLDQFPLLREVLLRLIPR